MSLIVFLHGFLGTSEDWEAVCSYLPNCHCLGIDLPGHGSSPFTKNFLEEMPHFKEPIHLIGYSMGGRLALQYALRFPHEIASLTLISTHPGLSNKKERKKRLETDRTWANLLLKLPIGEFLNRWYAQPIFSGFQPTRLKLNPQALAKTLMHYSLGHQSPLSTQHAHILLGERDTKFQTLYKTFTPIPNAGHAAHLENPKAVAAAILKGTLSP